ncbi:cytochrome P450 [Xylariomycetidae sp. FL0641]|nr:cytochrome P450 [Xylariomycetidae sp. FL0641]
MAILCTLGWCLCTLAAAWTLYSWLCLFRNYLSARKVGVPLRILPISHGNPFWMIVDRKVISRLRNIPFIGDSSFVRYNWRGWEIEDKCRSHLEMGSAYMHVTPGRNWLYLCEPDSLLEVFRRRNDFPRPLELFELLNVFGPNLSTVDGEQWKKQRKITATCFNDRNNEIVWSESISQATAMLRYWSAKASVPSIADDTRTLSLHVLSKAGFGKSFEFQGHDEKSPTTMATSYKESLQIVLDNCVLIMALGRRFLAKPWLPRRLRKVHEACESFQQYLTDLYENEKQAFSHRRAADPSNNTLMTSLVRASASASAAAAEAPASGGGLTEAEIYGNMFVLNFAGHDTTTHTLTFALMYLAAHPGVQEWVAEELAHVFGGTADGAEEPASWDYHAGFPRLRRCAAVLLETLRLRTPVPVAKWTGRRAQRLRVAGAGWGGMDKTLVVPADTMVIASYAAVHTHPSYWGSDARAWRPSRWIRTTSSTSKKPTDDNNNNNTTSSLPGAEEEEEELLTPRRGTFVAWSEGERSCPGRKFAQVEFVAAVAVLFRRWRVRPATTVGSTETVDQARARVLRQLETDSAQVLLLQMLHPERAPLVWTRRDG